MNIIKLYGGLGNQMFQYAFGRNLHENFGVDVMYDTTWFLKPTNPPRPYGLDKFRTNITQLPFIMGNNTIRESKNEYYNFVSEYLYKRDTNFAGYWQNMGYISKVIPLMREELRVHSRYYTDEYLDLKERIMGSPSIGLHVRRGDYVTVAGHYVLPLDYYKEALNRVKGNLFIFSDDVEWCKETFHGATVINLEDYLSFSLLQSCKSKIIANSTFSWWAAILNANPEDIVIAPKKWRMDSEEQRRMEDGNFCPNNWILL